jgi:serine/tyrosine/threonine adenylyltransferase
LVDDLLSLMRAQRVDFTSCFRSLSSTVRGDAERARSLFVDPEPFDAWSERWQGRLGADAHERRDAVARAMDGVNPVYIARNHLVEDALTAATDGDMAPFDQLLDVLARPFDERPGLEVYAVPAPASFGGYQTFCGT